MPHLVWKRLRAPQQELEGADGERDFLFSFRTGGGNWVDGGAAAAAVNEPRKKQLIFGQVEQVEEEVVEVKSPTATDTDTDTDTCLGLTLQRRCRTRAGRCKGHHQRRL